MEANRLELLVQQVEAAESLLERMMGQVGALSCELKAMKQELSVLSDVVSYMNDEQEAILQDDAHELNDEHEAVMPNDVYDLSEEFNDITEEEVKLIETSEAIAAEQVSEPVVEPVVKSEVSPGMNVDEQLTVAERFGQEKQAGNLNEQFVTRFKTSLSRSMSLNDRFRFQRELFYGSQAEMNEALAVLEGCSSFSEAWDYVCHKLDSELVADENNKALLDFRHLLEVHFS